MSNLVHLLRLFPLHPTLVPRETETPNLYLVHPGDHPSDDRRTTRLDPSVPSTPVVSPGDRRDSESPRPRTRLGHVSWYPHESQTHLPVDLPLSRPPRDSKGTGPTPELCLRSERCGLDLRPPRDSEPKGKTLPRCVDTSLSEGPLHGPHPRVGPVSRRDRRDRGGTTLPSLHLQAPVRGDPEGTGTCFYQGPSYRSSLHVGGPGEHRHSSR